MPATDLYAPPTAAELKGSVVFAPPTAAELKASSPIQAEPEGAADGEKKFLQDYRAAADQAKSGSNILSRGWGRMKAAAMDEAMQNEVGPGGIPLSPQETERRQEATQADYKAQRLSPFAVALPAGQAAAITSAVTSGASKALGALRGSTAAASPGLAAAEAPAVESFAMAKDALTQAAPKVAEAAKSGIKDTLLHFASKYPAIKIALGTGGVTTALHEAMKHPEAAAALTAIGAVGATPLGAAATSYGASQLLSDEMNKGKPPALSDLRGENKWTMRGFQNLLDHDSSGAFRDEATIDRAFASPKVRSLLAQAGDLKPGSKAMQNVVDQIQAQLKGMK